MSIRSRVAANLWAQTYPLQAATQGQDNTKPILSSAFRIPSGKIETHLRNAQEHLPQDSPTQGPVQHDISFSERYAFSTLMT
jgi:hypothetical protein